MSKSRNQVINYLSEIDITGKTVLDAGCGPEKYWAKNFVQGEAKEYVTLDINKKFKPDIVADLNKHFAFSDIPAKFIRRYDVVFCLETLEHVYKPVTAVENLYRHTKSELYISVPLINPIHNTHDYLRYTGEWFEQILPEVGFSNVEVKARKATTGVGPLKAFYKDEGLRMSKIRYKAGEGHKLLDIGYFVVAKK